MASLGKTFSEHLHNNKFRSSVLVGLGLLILSLVINYFAGLYATHRVSNYVSDIILSNIPVYDVDSFFVYGPFVFWLSVVYLCLVEPNRIPFIIKSVALFIVIRSGFVTLTHIAPFPYQAPIDVSLNLLKLFTTGNDLFFSGHTGLPFLMALIFWEHRRIAAAYICTALFFAAIVLMAHFHYSIDVLSAFFITYTIYHLSQLFFKKDKMLFEKGLAVLQ
jgi:hypothetical protein